MKKANRLAGVLAGAVIVSACQTNSYLYVQETVAGVDVGVGSTGNNRLSVGYTTDTFAVIPSKGDKKDAASSIAVISGAIQGISCFNYKQFNATGKAAKKLAEDGVSIAKVRDTLYDQSDSQDCK